MFSSLSPVHQNPYEVTNIASNTALAVSPNYLGANTSVGTYALAPMQGYVKDSADALRALVNQFGAKLAALGTTGNYDTLPVAKGGTGGQNQADARIGLGLGAVSTENTVPIAKGGTGRSDGRLILSEVGVQQAAALYNAQGLYMGWNSSSQGEGHFIVNRGGGLGGYSWRSVNADNTASGPTVTLSYDGVFTPAYLRPTNALELAYGGTGAKNASDAVTNLGFFNNSIRARFATSQLAAGQLSSVNVQGVYAGWNESNGGGEANFICNRGGGTGGFSWRSVNADNSATGSPMTYSYAGNLTVPGTVSQGSDRRLKKNDVDIVGALGKILAVRPVEFDRRSTLEDTEYPFHEAGVIAQELYEVLPILVTPANDDLGGEVWRVNYTGLIPYMISAIQDLKAQVDQLKAVQATAE